VWWQDEVRQRDAAWTRAEMRKSHARYREIFGVNPPTHGAAGWQMNATAFEQIDDWGMAYASDGRGNAPYRLAINGRTLNHVQMPTTLPTLDELIGNDGLDEANVARGLLKLTDADRDQVYTLHAELEGGLLAPAFEALLDGWRAQGHELVTMAGLYRHINPDTLPVRPLTWGTLPGRSGELIVA
jgi:peptidoglycan/xylan/chitin deacetylase (PgdA/CDA1 family)